MLFAGMQVDLGEAAVHVIFRVQTSRDVRAGRAVGVHSAREHLGQIKNRIARSAIAVCIESLNFQPGWAQPCAGCADCIASTDNARRGPGNWQRSGIHTRITERCRVSDVITLALIREKEKGLVLLQRSTNCGSELAETDLLFLTFAQEKRISGVGFIRSETVVARAVPRISSGLQGQTRP